MNDTPEQTRRIKRATKKAKTQYKLAQKEREKDMIKVELNDNNNTVIYVKKGVDIEKIKENIEK